MTSNWKQWFQPSAKSREARDTLVLYQDIERARSQSPFATDDSIQKFLTEMVVDICEWRGVTPSQPLGDALCNAIAEFLFTDGFVVELPKEESLAKLTIEEGILLREHLRRQLRFLTDHERLLPIWRRKLVILFGGLLEYFPLSAFADVDEEGNPLDDSLVLLAAKARDLCDNLPEALDRTITTFFDDDITNAHLFARIREQLTRNGAIASGIPEGEVRDGGRKITFPSGQKNQSPGFLTDAYFRGTPLEDFWNAGLPFAIPFPARFEHTHIIGGTGHGKTQLIQFLINHDLVRSQEDGRSVVVIDSQGDLIRTMSRLHCFSPEVENSLADRFVMIDPSDIEHPVALNMFDFNRDRLSGYAPLDREKILNATVELYDYFFGALLGAELTQRQGLIFRYLARLLIEIPGATIHTLRELMEDGEKFLPYMEKLSGTARSFFATRFFDKSFNETKKQILARLWGVLSNSALERMFSHKESKVDVFDLLNSGKILFINTAKDLLGQEGAAIFGRFFIALIAQAALQRAAQSPHERRPSFVYIDEAQDYFDANVANLLMQARKYRVGLIFAHQSLDQLGSELRGSVLSNTTIKFAGGVSAKDATAVAQELRTESEFVLAQKRGSKHTSFACSVRNYTGQALSIQIPLGYVESLPRLSRDDEEHLTESNRDTYCAPAEPVPDIPFAIKTKREEITPPKAKATKPEVSKTPPKAELSEAVAERPPRPSPPPPISDPGRGGQEHKYLQHLLKRLAEERGFRATIEETILNGDGQVDVSLALGKRRIACENGYTEDKINTICYKTCTET